MSRIEEFFEKSVDAGIIPQTPMNYDAVSCKIYAGYLENKIDELTAENTELRATLSKMETVEKELRERLNKAMGLPYMYEAEVVDSAGHFLKTIYVVVYNNNGTIQAIQYSYKKVAEARLKDLAVCEGDKG